MISIIICSINNELFEKISSHISSTIGVEHEIIKIENTKTNYGISKAYNLGADRAKYGYLCFIHEDVYITSSDWGIRFINFIKSSEAGILGLAGSKYKSLVPSGWSQGLYNNDYSNVIQHYKYEIKHKHKNVNTSFTEVVTLDGVFLFTTKKIWIANKFDEATFDGFHCYDLDICMQIGQNHSIYVYNEPFLEHFSSGSLNQQWVVYSIKLIKKWKDFLPIGNIHKKQSDEIEWRNRKIFFLRMNICGFPIQNSLIVFFSYNYFTAFNIMNSVIFFMKLIGKSLKLYKKPLY